jgi:hypothetical protein
LHNWKAVKHILRYLKGSRNLCIQYGKTPESNNLIGYSDADFGGDSDDRKSTIGYVFMLGNGPICWSSKRQTNVAPSTTEAEYMAGTQTIKEAIWLRRLLKDLGDEQTSPTVINMDNQSAIKLAQNPVFHARTKHIDMRYHFIREKVESQEVELTFCGTNSMLADLMTKALGKIKHQEFCKGMGMTLEDSLSGSVEKTAHP